MLERFRVPLEDQVRVSHESLRTTTAALFEVMGESPEDAAEGADVMVSTDLRGVETHGVSNLLRGYVASYNDGKYKAAANWRVLREAPATATIDADRGLVTILGPKFMRMAMEKAKAVGVGVVTVHNAGHSGAIGHHAMLAAQNDMVGMCMTAGGRVIAPTFGAEAQLGTNPIAIAAPARNEAPFLFDVATSAIAGNKHKLAARVGATLLPGWIAEPDGTPITEETPVREQGEYLGLPLGGTRDQGSHKGYGFAMMSEIMATFLSGALPNMLDGSSGARHYLAAYNIEAFTDVDEFKDNMDETLRTLKNTKPAPGEDRVYYPGLPEHEDEQDRLANGIPLHREVIEWFEHITGELSLPPLKTM